LRLCRPSKSGAVVDAKDDGFTVRHELVGPDPPRRFNDRGIPVGAVVAVPGEQANLFAVALDDQPVARITVTVH